MSKIKKKTPRAQRRKNERAAIKKSHPSANRKYSSSRSQRRANERFEAKNRNVKKPANSIPNVSLSDLEIGKNAELLAGFVFGQNQFHILNTIDLITTEHASRLKENQITFFFSEFTTEDLILLSPFDEEIAFSCLVHLYSLMMIIKAPLPPYKPLLIEICMIEQEELIGKLKHKKHD